MIVARFSIQYNKSNLEGELEIHSDRAESSYHKYECKLISEAVNMMLSRAASLISDAIEDFEMQERVSLELVSVTPFREILLSMINERIGPIREVFVCYHNTDVKIS